jgi:predicted AAA+ superfamily ATPase
MAPLVVREVYQNFEDIQTLWLRGGYPNSYLATNTDASWDWRMALIRHFLNTDMPALGINVEPQLMHRFWRMVAHLHGQLFNASAIAASMNSISAVPPMPRGTPARHRVGRAPNFSLIRRY